MVLVVLAAGGGDAGDRAPAGSETAAGTTGDGGGAGDALPDLEFTRFGSGEADSLHAYLGKPLVVNFFASWCVPCLAELPNFEQAHQAFKQQVNFLGLNLQDNPSSARRVIDDTGITYPVGEDPQGRIFQALGGFGMPTTIFVHADGTVTERYTGELTGPMLLERLRRHGFIEG